MKSITLLALLTVISVSTLAGTVSNTLVITDSVYTSVMQLDIIHKPANPNDSILYTVQNMPEGRSAILSIVEVSGRTIHSSPIESNSGQAKGILIPLETLTPGNYLVTVVSGKHTAIRQLTVQQITN